MPVLELPKSPTMGGRYVFSGLRRDEVNAYNHGLHKYPAKFIPQIPRWALQQLADTGPRVVVDPFCGSGTTVLESAVQGHISHGYDVNPLAVLISKAKTAILGDFRASPPDLVRQIIFKATRLTAPIRAQLEDGRDLGLHPTWRYWFQEAEMAKLLAMRRAIVSLRMDDALSSFLLACLSSIAKGSSCLSEDQIKVRKDHSKPIQDPFAAFLAFSSYSLERQVRVGHILAASGSEVKVGKATATALPLEDASVDEIITSPPYINAVDYTMTHKYNFSILGLVAPAEFKAHCREYFGLTERAVRMRDIRSMPVMGDSRVDAIIQQLWDSESSVGRNRAYVVWNYFSGMRGAFREMHRVLHEGGQAVVVVGTVNRICGIPVPTGALLEHLANGAGLGTQLHFFHHVNNVSSMRLNRSATGGAVKEESVYAFKR
jgi:hypothetical protein